MGTWTTALSFWALTLGSPSAVAQDTLVVEADNPPLWGDSPRLVEELRVGSLDGDVATTFGRIVALAVDSAGVIWIADSQGPSLRRFARDGTFLGNVGRPGEGPGEFAGLSGVRVVGEDRMAVWDAHGGRVSIFDLSGRFLTSVSHYVGVFYAPNPFVVHPDGYFLIHTVRLGGPPNFDAPRRRLWIKIDHQGSLVDSVMVPPSGRTIRGGRIYPFGEMYPFEPATISEMGPDGALVVVNTGRYTLQRRLEDGRLVEVRRSWEPISVEPDERAQHRALAKHVAGLWGPGYADDVPATKPPVWAFRIDSDGRYWVARHSAGVHVPETEAEREHRRELSQVRGSEPPPLEWWEPLVTDVLDPRGQYLGTIRFSNNRQWLGEARGLSVWMIERGEFDEEYVVRYRIEASR